MSIISRHSDEFGPLDSHGIHPKHYLWTPGGAGASCTCACSGASVTGCVLYATGLFSYPDGTNATGIPGWTVEAGTWFISGGKLCTQSSNAIIKLNTASDVSPFEAMFRFNTSGFTQCDEYRVYMNYAGGSNSWYWQQRIQSGFISEFSSPFQPYQPPISKVFKNSVEQQIWNNFGNPAAFWFGANYFGAVSSFHSALHPIKASEIVSSGQYCALGTGSITGTVGFDTIKMERTAVSNSGLRCPGVSIAEERQTAYGAGHMWTPLTGGWIVPNDSGFFICTSAGKIRWNHRVIDDYGDGAAMIASAYVNIYAAQRKNPGDKIRVLVDMSEDGSTYHFAEFEILGAGGRLPVGVSGSTCNQTSWQRPFNLITRVGVNGTVLDAVSGFVLNGALGGGFEVYIGDGFITANGPGGFWGNADPTYLHCSNPEDGRCAHTAWAQTTRLGGKYAGIEVVSQAGSQTEAGWGTGVYGSMWFGSIINGVFGNPPSHPPLADRQWGRYPYVTSTRPKDAYPSGNFGITPCQFFTTDGLGGSGKNPTGIQIDLNGVQSQNCDCSVMNGTFVAPFDDCGCDYDLLIRGAAQCGPTGTNNPPADLWAYVRMTTANFGASGTRAVCQAAVEIRGRFLVRGNFIMNNQIRTDSFIPTADATNTLPMTQYGDLQCFSHSAISCVEEVGNIFTGTLTCKLVP